MPFLWVKIKVDQNGGSDSWVYKNEDALGLAFATVEPGVGAALDVVTDLRTAANYTKVAANITKSLAGGLIAINIGLTAYVVNQDLNNGTYNTHTLADIGVTTVGVVLTGIGLVISAPALAIGGAAIGIGYGIWTVTGGDARIDSATNNWGRDAIDYWKK